MKFALTLGAAFAALTLAAAAHSDTQRIFLRHGGGMNIDADNDGWVTRTEASAATDAMFERLDSNNDGLLNGEDRAPIDEFNIHVDIPEIRVLEGGDDDADDDDDGGERHVTIIRRNGDVDEERIQVEVERAVREAERAAEEAERSAEQIGREAEREARAAERRAERAEREAEQAAERAEREAERAAERSEREAERGERHVSREVIIVRGNDGEWTRADGVIAPVPPVPAVPPVHPPMFMMLIANSEEADLNGDGALSRDEFRAQHLRFFDASDANGDGRVRFEAPPIPPAPPTPPTAPTPPAPPAPPRHR